MLIIVLNYMLMERANCYSRSIRIETVIVVHHWLSKELNQKRNSQEKLLIND